MEKTIEKTNKRTKAQTIPNKPFYAFLKRAFDIVSSFCAIVILSPLFIILSIIVKCSSPGSVFYVHQRIGKNGKKIGILKFRSMLANADNLIQSFNEEQKKEYFENFKLKEDPRITKAGKFLRKTSLDELPQLLNIFIGDLSVVGPRPVTQEETLLYGENRDLLLSVKPGLTGWWAANGRSQIDYGKRIEMELFYIKNRSVLLDLKIIFKTAVSVFKREGAR